VSTDDKRRRTLFNGTDLTGWEGDPVLWSVRDGMIIGRNVDPVATSSYLFTTDIFRDFRLTLQVRQTYGPEVSTMHSAVAAVGQRFVDGGDPYGFRGQLLMFCGDWGIFDAYGRSRVVPGDQKGFWEHPAERRGEWNAIEILIIGDRIRMAANDELLFDHTDEPGRLRAGPIGLQLHANDRRQEFSFRDLVIAEEPSDQLLVGTS